MSEIKMYRLGRHWLCSGDPSNYDDVYSAINQTYREHFIIDTMGQSLGIAVPLLDYRLGKYKGNGKTYPEAREYADKWNNLANKSMWIKADEVEILTGLIEDISKEGDVIVSYWDFAVETLIACEVTGRVALVMGKSQERCGIIKQKWIAIKVTHK